MPTVNSKTEYPFFKLRALQGLPLSGVTIDLDKKLDQQLPDYLRALWTYATPLCIRFVFISFVEECLNIFPRELNFNILKHTFTNILVKKLFGNDLVGRYPYRRLTLQLSYLMFYKYYRRRKKLFSKVTANNLTTNKSDREFAAEIFDKYRKSSYSNCKRISKARMRAVCSVQAVVEL